MNNPSPDVSLIIINYNGLRHLKDCFNSIKKTSYPFENIDTIMVDNASTDGSIEYVKESYPWVRVLALDKNYGFAKANNIGAENAKGEYIVFLNNDTVVDSNWLAPLVDVMKGNKDVGIAGSKILLYDNQEKINSAGARITFMGGGYDIGFLDNDSGKYNVPGYRASICAAAMIVRKNEFLQSGGFDEDYFMYFEDVDLCWRYWLYGKRIEYIPASIVCHKFGGTSGKERHAPLRVFYGTRNSLFNIVKNYEPRNIFLALMAALSFHGLKTLCFLAMLEFSSVFSMIRAYRSFVIKLPIILKRRSIIQKRRKVKDEYLFENSIISPVSADIKEFRRLFKAK
ncbi:MAG TPA: glycosyltransferase family 2 protein [Nitrospirae bacterium]|nr:glycosyltransferase family 2 protein [Nitrospirota bacterium]